MMLRFAGIRDKKMNSARGTRVQEPLTIVSVMKLSGFRLKWIWVSWQNTSIAQIHLFISYWPNLHALINSKISQLKY